MQHTRHDDGRDLDDAQGSARDDLACGLEAQEGDGHALAPIDVVGDSQLVEPAFDDIRLDDDGNQQDNRGLHGERKHHRSPFQPAQGAGDVREGGAAPGERDDGDEGFGPAVGVGGVVGGGGAEAEEHGVACLAGDEGAEGVEDGAVEDAGDEAADQKDVGGVG